MAVLMALVSVASFAAGVEPLRAVGSFAVGDPRHRRAEIRFGLMNLLLLLAALPDWVVPWLGVPAWETSLALVVMAVYTHSSACGGTHATTGRTTGQVGGEHPTGHSRWSGRPSFGSRVISECWPGRR
jgi:hypothetical protein